MTLTVIVISDMKGSGTQVIATESLNCSSREQTRKRVRPPVDEAVLESEPTCCKRSSSAPQSGNPHQPLGAAAREPSTKGPEPRTVEPLDDGLLEVVA